MPKPCGICSHPSRRAIEQAIVNLKPMTAIARDFGFTYTRGSDGATVPDHSVVRRHRDNHMRAAYDRAVDEADQETASTIATRVRFLDEQVDHVITEARRGTPVLVADVPLLHEDGSPVMAYDHRLLLRAVVVARGNVELMAKLMGKTEADAADLDAVRAHLRSPEARRLLAELEALAARETAQDAGRST